MAYLTENINDVTSELKEIFEKSDINEFLKEISYYATYLFLLLTNYEDCDSKDLFRKNCLTHITKILYLENIINNNLLS